MSLANRVLRFVLELGAIAAASYSGYQLTAFGGPSRWVAAVGAPLAVILLWALTVAPRTQNGLSPRHKERIGSAILLVTAGALALAGQPTLAIGFGVAVVLNVALLVVFGHDAFDRLSGVAS